MSIKQIFTSDNYIPGKLARLQNNLETIEGLQTEIEDLQEEIVLDIIDGWTTGDSLLDFVFTANNGVYDQSSHLEYEKIANLGLRHPNSVIMVIQFGIHKLEDPYVSFISNVYLATLRKEETRFNLDQMTMSLPVQANYLSWMQAVKDGFIMSGYKLVQGNTLEVGPISNEFCNNSFTTHVGDGYYRTTEDSPCYIELLPLDSNLNDYRITDEHLVYLLKLWTKLKSTTTTLA